MKRFISSQTISDTFFRSISSVSSQNFLNFFQDSDGKNAQLLTRILMRLYRQLFPIFDELFSEKFAVA